MRPRPTPPRPGRCRPGGGSKTPKTPPTIRQTSTRGVTAVAPSPLAVTPNAYFGQVMFCADFEVHLRTALAADLSGKILLQWAAKVSERAAR